MCVRVIFAPILPLLEDEFAITHAQSSSIFIFLAVGYGFSMFFSGVLAGRFGYKKSIATSLLVTSTLFFLVPFVKVFSVLYLFGFVLGLSIGMYLPSAIPLITEYFAEKNWGKSIAIHDSGAAVSIFSAPLIAIFLLHFVTWRGMFVVFAMIFLSSAIIFCLTSDEVKVAHSGVQTFGNLIRKRSIWIMGILATFASGANLGVYAIVPLYLTKELSLTMEYGNTILAISRLGGIGIAVLAGFLIDRVSLKLVMFLTVLIAGIFTVLLGTVSVSYVGIVLFVQAIVVTGFFPIALVSIAKMFNREMRSMATGIILTLAIVFGVGIMPYFLGLSGDHISFRFGLVILGILVCLSGPLAFSLKELE